MQGTNVGNAVRSEIQISLCVNNFESLRNVLYIFIANAVGAKIMKTTGKDAYTSICKSY